MSLKVSYDADANAAYFRLFGAHNDLHIGGIKLLDAKKQRSHDLLTAAAA